METTLNIVHTFMVGRKRWNRGLTGEKTNGFLPGKRVCGDILAVWILAGQK
jgi:hypothetical protein